MTENLLFTNEPLSMLNKLIYQEEVAKILFKLLHKKGIMNIGGNFKFIYDFAKKDNPNIKKYQRKNNYGVQWTPL